mgnify:CR=1 FL=1
MSETIKISFKVLRRGAAVPSYGTPGSAGADLYALLDEPLVIHPGETRMVGTGIACEIPDGYAGLIFARSGLATKQGLAPANKVGVVDPDYRGEWMIGLHNHSGEDRTVCSGDRIAQVVFVPFAHAAFVETSELSDTSRGGGGFGSTGY